MNKLLQFFTPPGEAAIPDIRLGSQNKISY